MSAKGKEQPVGKSISDLVDEWVRLDNPDSIERAVRRWTEKKTSKRKETEIPT